MNKKIFRLILTGTFMVLFLSVMISVSILHTYYVKIHEEEIRSEARYIAAALSVEGEAYIKAVQSQTKPDKKSDVVIKTENDSRVTWIAEDGSILYDSKVDISEMDNHNDRKEVIEARNKGTGESTRFSLTLSKRTYYYCILLSNQTVLRISTDRGTILGILLSMFQPLAIIIFITVVISVAISGRISNKILEPINKINLESPSMEGVYEELAPLVRRLTNQNMQIQSQIRELKQKQQEFLTILENMREGLLVYDREGNIMSCNQGALFLLTGTGNHEEKMEEVHENRELAELVKKSIPGKRTEKKMILSGRICQVIASPVIEEEQAMGCIVMLFDVTEQEENEQFRREFTANVSHELKTPLTSISGFAEIIQNKIARPEDIEKFTGNIYKESQRLITLIGDIINLSRLDENNSLPEKCETDISTIVEKVVTGLQEAAGKKQVRMETELEQCTIQAIPAIVEEMVYNICDNAIKYNHEGGKVFISIKTEENRTVFTVRDTGIGIPYEDRERVFERFYRVNKSHSKEIGGTGLGLSIVKHGALIHNAKITLDSSLEEGTIISLSFPSC